MPNSVTHRNWTPIFEWYVIRCGSKNKYQKYTCLKEMGLRAQIITILGSIVNIIGSQCDCLMNTSILTLIMTKIFM